MHLESRAFSVAAFAAYTRKTAEFLRKASFPRNPSISLVHLLMVHEKFPVAMRLGETPVPIPNTMVKTQAADGTMLETAWESRWLPDSRKGL